jgi:hypothetical protein
MSEYVVKNWGKFQHFKDRKPPWIKLYRDILDDPEWFDLSGNDAKALVMLWLIASENFGCLPDIRRISFRLRITETACNALILRLKHWIDIATISQRYRNDTPETETETETETEGETEGDSCTEPEIPASMPAAVAEMPLVDGSMFTIIQSDLDMWADAFPAVNVMSEIKRMNVWLDANKAKRKTRSGIKSFISKWLTKEQDKGGGMTRQTAGPWRPDLAIGQVRPGTPELVTAWEKKNEEELAKL